MSKNESNTSKMQSNEVAAVVTQGRGLLEKLAAEVVELETRRTELFVERQRLELQRAQILEAPLSQANVLQLVDELVDYRAKSYPAFCERAKLSELLAYPEREKLAASTACEDAETEGGVALKWPINFKDAQEVLGHECGGVKTAVPPLKAGAMHFPLFIMPKDSSAWIYFFFGDLIKEKVKAQITKNGLPWDEEDRDACDVSFTERRAMLQECNQKIDGLNTQITALDAAIEELSFGPDTPAARKQVVAETLQNINQLQAGLGQIYFVLSELRLGGIERSTDSPKKQVYTSVQSRAWGHDSELKRFKNDLHTLENLGFPLEQYREKLPAITERINAVESSIQSMRAEVEEVR